MKKNIEDEMLPEYDFDKGIRGKYASLYSATKTEERNTLIKKIEIGLEQSEKGKTVTTKEAKKRLKHWL